MTFADPSRALRVLAALGFYRAQRDRALVETQPRREGFLLRPTTYNEADALELLREHGVPVVPLQRAHSKAEAITAGRVLGFPVVMKVLSSDITHKSDVGGVVLGIADESELACAYDGLLTRVAAAAPGARIDGVLVAPMVRGGVECILGVHRDPVLGHMVMLGAGGVNVELLRDVSFRVAPVDREQADGMLAELKTAALLRGFRGAPLADTGALADAIVSLSQFAVAAGESLESIDLNPFVVLPEGRGAVALDAVVLGREPS